MSNVNIKLLKAGLATLIHNDEACFIDRLSAYLKEHDELLDYFFDGPLEINDEVKQKLEEIIKADVPIKDDFLGIEDIKIAFNWNGQMYQVNYKARRYFNANKQPYEGQTYRDDEHPIGCERIVSTTIDPNKVK